jgi:hypothetical protein
MRLRKLPVDPSQLKSTQAGCPAASVVKAFDWIDVNGGNPRCAQR